MDLSNLPPLDVDRIRVGLADSSIAFNVIYLPSIDSTNRYLRDLSDADFRHGITILTDYQESGRGRLGRTWIAPPRTSLLASIALEKPETALASDFVMLAGLAVREAVQAIAGIEASLKWPNDVFLNSRKVAGILSEALVREGREFGIIGIGVNVNFDPEKELSITQNAQRTTQNATSIGLETGNQIDRADLALTLFKRLELWYRDLVQNSGSIFTAWAAALNTIGCDVAVEDATGIWQGTATHVRRDGGLIVRTAEGAERTVYAANVSIRTTKGFNTT